jgi:hypothetical protein
MQFHIPDLFTTRFRKKTIKNFSSTDFSQNPLASILPRHNCLTPQFLASEFISQLHPTIKVHLNFNLSLACNFYIESRFSYHHSTIMNVHSANNSNHMETSSNISTPMDIKDINPMQSQVQTAYERRKCHDTDFPTTASSEIHQWLGKELADIVRAQRALQEEAALHCVSLLLPVNQDFIDRPA